MSAQVDVLAVMNWSVSTLLSNGYPHSADELRQARVAVAALIAERDALAQEVERLKADGVHSCGPHCQRPMCVLERELDALREEVAALRQQPAPVDLEQFREALIQWSDDAFHKSNGDINHPTICEADRLLSIIDNAGKVEPAREVRLWDSQWVNIVNAPEVLNAIDREEAVNIAVRMTERSIASNVASSNLPPTSHQPAPVVDDAVVERAAVALSNFDRPHPNPEDFWSYRSEESREKYRGRVRAALTAALARAHGVQS